MCNFCHQSRSGCGCNFCNGWYNSRSGCGCNSCGCCNVFADALFNLFSTPCCNGYNGCNRRGGCGCNSCGCDLSVFTNCGCTDAYFARQYGLVSSCDGGCSCNCNV